MSIASFKIAAATAVLAAAFAPAQALTLNTAALKANSTITFSAEGFSNATAATVKIKPYGNTVQLADATAIGSSGREVKVPVFQFPVTKADVSVGWDLKIEPVSGQTARSALRLTSDFGDVVLANFDLNFKENRLYADVLDFYGQKSTRVVLYTTVKTKPSVISLKGFVLNQTAQVGDLMFTPESRDLVAAALGLDEVLKAALAQLKWGTIDVLVTSFARKPAVNATPLKLSDVTEPTFD